MSLAAHQSVLEPHWHSLEGTPAFLLPPLYGGWLADPGSLTARVIGACGSGNFRVRLIGQHWGRPLYSEKHLLKMRRGEIALIREVELLCNGLPWVFARTLIPASSFSGRARQLARLREKPLGAVLFADPTTVRGKMQIARLQHGHPLFHHAIRHLHQPPAELWGRRTLFYYARHPLLVNEIFLPDIPKQSA
ncbi:MAG: chorismate lyase [Chromatiales bacterium]|jgi:chorismate--pyruvate lyase